MDTISDLCWCAGESQIEARVVLTFRRRNIGVREYSRQQERALGDGDSGRYAGR